MARVRHEITAYLFKYELFVPCTDNGELMKLSPLKLRTTRAINGAVVSTSFVFAYHIMADLERRVSFAYICCMNPKMLAQ
jgi:hypothetical protein